MPPPTLRRAPAREPAFWLLLVLMAGYTWLAWVTSGQAERWILTLVDGQQLFAIDDAYRYYIARTAWANPDIYTWSYVLPGAALLDGILASLTGGNLWLMRALHVVAAFGTLWLTFMTGVRLGAGRLAMTLSVLLLALMPLFAFTFLSFYAENWLALVLAGGLYCLADRRERAAAALFALLPLIRPEGIFLIAPVALYWLLQRRLGLLVILGGPGLVYALWLLATLDSPATYTRWRLELLGILRQAKDAGMRRPWGFFDACNLLWIAPALAGFLAPALRSIRPLLAGGVLWLAGAVAFVASGNAFHEARYYLSVLPLLALGWPFAFSWLAGALPKTVPGKLPAVVFVLLTLFVSLEHLRQLDPVKAAWGNQRWPLAGIPAARDFFATLSPRAMQVRAGTAEAIARIAAGNPAIDRVLLVNTEIFYHLDPAIAARAQVIYVPTNEAIANAWLHGNYFGMHPGGRQYDWFRLRAPRPDDARLALFVGRLGSTGLPAVYQDGLFAIYLVALDVADRPLPSTATDSTQQ